jgi:fatty acid desaturase
MDSGDQGPSSLRVLARQLLDPRDPALLRLSQLRPARVLADVARCYGLIGLAGVLLALSDPWWVVAIPCFLLVASQQYALAILTHDGRHGRLLRSRAANDWLSRVIIGAPILHDIHYASEVALHAAHHRGVGTLDDPERHLYAAADKATRVSFLLYLTGLPAVPKVLRKLVEGNRSTSSRLPRATHASPLRRNGLGGGGWLLTVSVHAAMVALLSLFAAWWYYPIFWLGPLYTVFVAKKVRVLCEHGQPVLPDTAADARRLITFVPNRLERWAFAPMNMHYHAEHHLWAFIPYYNLPALHRLIAGRSTAIEVRRSYMRYLRDYFLRLPLVPAPS